MKKLSKSEFIDKIMSLPYTELELSKQSKKEIKWIIKFLTKNKKYKNLIESYINDVIDSSEDFQLHKNAKKIIREIEPLCGRGWRDILSNYIDEHYELQESLQNNSNTYRVHLNNDVLNISKNDKINVEEDENLSIPEDNYDEEKDICKNMFKNNTPIVEYIKDKNTKTFSELEDIIMDNVIDIQRIYPQDNEIEEKCSIVLEAFCEYTRKINKIFYNQFDDINQD